jgi:hypothetical protein
MKVNQCLRQRCRLYVVEVVNERKGPSLDQYPVLLEFQDVFLNELPGLPPKRELDFTIELKPGALNELPGLPPKRELDFTIELKPGAEPISKTPYRMTAPELCELQMQLKVLLDLGRLGRTGNFCKEEVWILTTMYRLQGLEPCYSEK